MTEFPSVQGSSHVWLASRQRKIPDMASLWRAYCSVLQFRDIGGRCQAPSEWEGPGFPPGPQSIPSIGVTQSPTPESRWDRDKRAIPPVQAASEYGPTPKRNYLRELQRVEEVEPTYKPAPPSWEALRNA
jgi:hypothetical protein